MKGHLLVQRATVIAIAVMLTLTTMPAFAQTRISMPKNKYKVQDDIKLGNDAARQAEQQFPLVNDYDAQNYVEAVGERLVRAIPAEFQQPAFDYRFKVVNASDINAFALPGGPMYVNRGMIEAARTEGEMAGVMAHEISHVALRHATAQATKQGSIGNQLGMLGMILGGAILGGQTGAQLGMLGAQAWMTKYSRDYETQADMLGARILANAGYDPRDLANMFQTIARQGGSRGPEWLSSHPDPGNRYQKIMDESTRLNVRPDPIRLTRDFERVQSRLRQMPQAPTMEQIARQSEGRGGTQNPTAGGRYSRNVPTPSRRYRTYNNGGIAVNVPDNWRDFGTQSSVTFAPEGAYGDNGITHGLMIGAERPQVNDLYRASQDHVNGLLQSNTYLRQQNQLGRTSVNGRQAYTTTLAGRSPITNETEVVQIFVVGLRTGEVLTLAFVAPDREYRYYQSVFRNITNSLRVND